MDRRTLTLSLLLSALTPRLALASAKKAEGGEKKKKSDGTYLVVGLVTASIMRSNGRRAILTVETGVDVPDPALYAKVDRLTPRLQAAYVQAIQMYAAGLTSTGIPDADYISRELQKQTDLVVGGRGAKLLLGSVMIN